MALPTPPPRRPANVQPTGRPNAVHAPGARCAAAKAHFTGSGGPSSLSPAQPRARLAHTHPNPGSICHRVAPGRCRSAAWPSRTLE